MVYGHSNTSLEPYYQAWVLSSLPTVCSKGGGKRYQDLVTFKDKV